jgi:hypothetical protein
MGFLATSQRGFYGAISMRTTILLSLAAAGLLAGCASLNEDQCRQGDWAGIGQSDGYAGYAMTRLQDHAEACRKLGITPDSVAYSRGRQVGLRGYCTASRGFAEGRMGNIYAGVCPPDLAPAFMAAYNDGRIVNVAVIRRNTAANVRAEATNRIRQLDDNIRDAQAKLASAATPGGQQDALRRDIDRMRHDRQQAENRARGADRELRRAEDEIRDLHYRFAARYPAW